MSSRWPIEPAKSSLSRWRSSLRTRSTSTRSREATSKSNENLTKNRHNIEPESPNIDLGTLSSHPGRPTDVPGAPRSALGSPRAKPRRPPGRGPVRPGTPIESPRGGRERAKATNFTAKLPPESKISSSVRASRSKSCGAAICRRMLSFFGVFAKRANPSEVPHLSAKTEVGPFALRVESLVRCNLEKPRKSTRKSTRNRQKSRLGASRAPFSVDFCRSERLGRATQGDSGRLERLRERLGATETVEVGRSGTVGSARSRGVARTVWR